MQKSQIEIANSEGCDLDLNNKKKNGVVNNDLHYTQSGYKLFCRRYVRQAKTPIDGKSIVQTLRSLHDKAQLDPLAESLQFSPTRPAEELYEWTTDCWQVANLAAAPANRQTLEQLRARLDQWMIGTDDHDPESDAMYDSDMAADLGKGNPVVERNIALMKQWAKSETNAIPTNSKAK